LTVLDTFNRGNAINLGPNWQQLSVPFLGAGIRVNTNQANTALAGNAYWNAGNAEFGLAQYAAFTFANTTVSNAALYLKAAGTFNVLGFYTNAIRVRYTTTGGPQVIVETTTNGLAYSPVVTLPATFANGNTLTAMVEASGRVTVWKTAGGPPTVLGTANTTFTGSGRVGMSLPTGARVDNFAGGSVQ
jgi:hypothetical protein